MQQVWWQQQVRQEYGSGLSRRFLECLVVHPSLAQHDAFLASFPGSYCLLLLAHVMEPERSEAPRRSTPAASAPQSPAAIFRYARRGPITPNKDYAIDIPSHNKLRGTGIFRSAVSAASRVKTADRSWKLETRLDMRCRSV